MTNLYKNCHSDCENTHHFWLSLLLKWSIQKCSSFLLWPLHFCIFVSANTNQTICVQELDSTFETVNLKVSSTNQLKQLIILDYKNGLMSRLLMSLTLLFKKVEVLENEVMGLIPTPVQIYWTIKHQTAQLWSSLSSLEHQITILNRRYR